MARQLRIEYPGAFYHIASRGNEKQRIFHAPEDKAFFLDLLSRTHERFGVLFHAFCLMENHYHLFVETPEPNLSRAMHFLNTAYTIYLNKRRNRVGHLFQGRFKAMLVEANIYARELVRYIHLNPVRAGMASKPEEYLWSSHREYLGLRRASPWIITSFVLRLFSDNEKIARRAYLVFIYEAAGGQIQNPTKNERGKDLPVLGSTEFLQNMKEQLGSRQPKTSIREVPGLRHFNNKPSLARISAEVEAALRDMKPLKNLIRNVSIYLSHKQGDFKLTEISKHFHISISLIAHASRKTMAIMEANENLRRIIVMLEETLFS